MKLKNRYIKCFNKKKKEQLDDYGYKFLYEANGVYWFENNQNLTKFSAENNLNILNGCKYSIYLPM